ncbi:hypothetical protein QUF90_18275 [Desulfococcaceae bacterium HSG9]|nr:hypothetical protein [Desulfococcaceae bacterium HSG9]
MKEIEYKFTVVPERRERTFFHVIFLAYPAIIFGFLFCKKPFEEKLPYIFFFPVLALRNLIAGLKSHFLFRVDVAYCLILYDSHIAFGVSEDVDNLLANSYNNIKRIFKSYSSWAALLHDGWIIYLPPGNEGGSAVNFIRKKRNKHNNKLLQVPPEGASYRRSDE